MPDGTVFDPFYSYSRRSYVVIVAQTADGRFLCVRQFRPGVERVTVEFPAGGIERTDGREYALRSSLSGQADREPSAGALPASSEDALETAKRELAEETGHVSDDWTHLLTIPSNATIADNYAHLYLARNCRPHAETHLDETEFLTVETYSTREIEDMIANSAFEQAMHVTAWLLAQRILQP